MFIRVTPDLPKLCEAAARNCYNSFHLSKPDGHKLVKNLMNMPKPHLSIGQHGNILVCLTLSDELSAKQIRDYTKDLPQFLLDLLYGSHNYLTVSTKQDHPDSTFEAVISGNPVAWTNALNYVGQLTRDVSDVYRDHLYGEVLGQMMSVPETMFFISKKEGYALKDNPYLLNLQRDERSKILVHDDFSDLLTEKERMLHETATVLVRTSRDMSMQMNRHDAGISQLSQRYVLPFDLEGQTFKQFMETFTQETYDNVHFNYHVPEGIDPEEIIALYDNKHNITFDSEALLWNREMTYEDMMKVIKTFFFSIWFHQMSKGETHKRANEQARSILPNNMDTVIYYTRSKWRWKHFIDLRVDNHTQIEQRREIIPLLRNFQTIGWFNNYTINEKNLTAEEYQVGIDLVKGEDVIANNEEVQDNASQS